MSSLSSWTATQFDPKLSWDDVKRFQDRWGGKLILKGILDPEDAESAAKTGADASSSPTTAAANWMAPCPRSPPCPRSWTPSARRSRC